MVGDVHLPVVVPLLEALGTLHLPELEAARLGWALRLATVRHPLALAGQVEVVVGAIWIKGQISIIY